MNDDDDDEFSETMQQYINSNLQIILSKFYLQRSYQALANELDVYVEYFEKNGSGWVLNEIMGCDIRIAKFEILTAGCYIELPLELQLKKAIVNPRSNEHDCFINAFLICMPASNTTKNKNRITQYEKRI